MIEELAGLALRIPAGTFGLALDGAASVRLARLQTRMYLRAQGVTGIDGLPRFLHEHRRSIEQWMRQDSRFHQIVFQEGHVPEQGGAYLQDYLQEYILSQAASGNAELAALGDLLQALALVAAGTNTCEPAPERSPNPFSPIDA